MKENTFSVSTRIVNERGSLLLTSYALIVVIMILGAAFILISINESQVAERQKRSIQALAIAEAGLERALYDLRQDFINDPTAPSFSDGTINSYTIGPDTSSFYDIPYASTTLNGGSYAVQLKNVTGASDAVWVKSAASVGDTSQTIQVYAKITSVLPWNNAIFAGAGASGMMVNGNVNIRGSVHILGLGLNSTDYAIDLGGTADIVGNNYNGLAASLLAKVPALPTTIYNGETVSTLNAVLRVKRGRVGLSGSATAGEVDIPSNPVKETVDAVYVEDGFGGSQGTSSVYSDNGWSNGYDLGESMSFPSLSDPYPGYSSYQNYLKANALVISSAAELNQLNNITPNSSFSFSSGQGSVSMSGGNLTVSGIVYIDGGSFTTSKSGPDKTITYSGTGSILATGNIQIDTDLVTNGNNSFPSNNIGFMTPGTIGFNEANINVMGLFYAETAVVAQKQTNILGTIVSNYFNMGTNVPAIYQVPETINYLPPGLIGTSGSWVMQILDWQRL